MAPSTLVSVTAALAFLTIVTTTVASAQPSKEPPSPSPISWPSRMVSDTETSLKSSDIPITTADGMELGGGRSSSNLSEEEKRLYLIWLQEDTVQKLIPTMVYLATLGLVGLFGNSLVLAVYSKKARRSATDIFIMAIAGSDLMANLLAIPGEFYDTFHFWDAHSSALCKCRVFLNAWTAVNSGHLLFAVAFCRYRKICRPHGRQMSPSNAKIISLVIVLVTAVYSVPTAMVYGIQTIPTPKAGVSGHKCFTDDRYDNTIWPLLNSGFLSALFFGFGIPLIVFYVLVGIQAWRHRTFMIQNNQMALYLEENIEGQRPKNKKKATCIVLGNSSNDEEVGKERGAKITGKPAKTDEQQEAVSETEETSIDEDDYWYTNRMRLWTAPVGNLMANDFNLRRTKIREREADGVKGFDITEDDEKLRQEALSRLTLILESDYSNNEGKKMEEQNDITDYNTQERIRSQSVKISRPKILTHKRDGTLNSTEKGKDQKAFQNGKETKALKETVSTSTAIACGNNQLLNARATDTDTADENRAVLTNCDLSSPKNPPNVSFKPKQNRMKRHVPRTVLTRTTLMLIIISAVFLIAFLPYLLLMTFTYTVPDFCENMSGAGFAAYNVFLRFYFVNSAANAIIYSLCDIRFRDQAKKIIRAKCQSN